MKPKKIGDKKDVSDVGRHALDTPVRSFQEVLEDNLRVDRVEPVESTNKQYPIRDVLGRVYRRICRLYED